MFTGQRGNSIRKEKRCNCPLLLYILIKMVALSFAVWPSERLALCLSFTHTHAHPHSHPQTHTKFMKMHPKCFYTDVEMLILYLDIKLAVIPTVIRVLMCGFNFNISVALLMHTCWVGWGVNKAYHKVLIVETLHCLMKVGKTYSQRNGKLDDRKALVELSFQVKQDCSL